MEGWEVWGVTGVGRENKDLMRRQENSESILDGTLFYFKQRCVIAHLVY